LEIEREIVDRQDAAKALRERFGYDDRRYAITRPAAVGKTGIRYRVGGGGSE
jgi:hypothetical protein